MPDWIEGALIPLVAIAFVADKVIAILRNRGIDLNDWGKVLERLGRIRWEEWRRQDNDLYQWHKIEDDKGKLWYNRWLAEPLSRQEKQNDERNKILGEISMNQVKLISAFQSLESRIKDN